MRDLGEQHDSMKDYKAPNPKRNKKNSKEDKDFLKNQSFQTYGCWGEGVWGGHIHTAIFKLGNQQGPTV